MGTFVSMNDTLVLQFQYIIPAKSLCSTLRWTQFLCPRTWTFFFPLSFVLHQAHSRYRAVDFIWIGPYLRQHLSKVICSNCHTHWIAAIGWLYCEGHLFLCCLADFCCLLVSSVKARWEGKKVSVLTSVTFATSVWHTQKKKNVSCSVYHMLFISTYCWRLCRVCVLFISFLQSL